MLMQNKPQIALFHIYGEIGIRFETWQLNRQQEWGNIVHLIKQIACHNKVAVLLYRQVFKTGARSVDSHFLNKQA